MNIDVFYTIALGFIASIPLILFKKASDERFSSWTYSFWWSALAMLFIAPLALRNYSVPSSQAALFFLALSALSWTLTNMFTMLAFKHTDASVVLLVARLSNVSIFLIGWLFLGDGVNLPKFFGLLLTVIGSMALAYQKGKLQFSKGLIYSLLPVIFLTTAFFFDKQATSHFNPFVFIFLQQILETGFSFLGIRNKHEVKDLFVAKKQLLIPAILFFVLGYSGFITLLGRNQLSVLPLTYETTIFLGSMILGTLYLKEREQMRQKILGTILALTGAVLLSF